MKHFQTRALATAVASASLLLVPGVSQAQGMLDEIIVTAQKREQSLQDVPVAVTAFTGAQLEKTGVKDMFDLQANAPSLAVSSNQTSTTTAFAIRGVYTSSQNFGLEPSVGLYVDGVYRARQSSMINNLVDIASVEILRGPQGTLFGRNTPAGAITITSAKPDFDGTGFLEATAGDYGLLGLNGAKSFSALDDTLAMRVTGFAMERDGYIDMVDGDDEVVNDRDRWGAKFQALYEPRDDLTIHFIADYAELDETCCAAGSYKNNLVAQDLPPGEASYTGTDANIVALGGTVIDQDDFYDRVISVGRPPKSENEDRGVSLQVDWDNNGYTLTSITAYRAYDSYDNADILFTNLDGAYRINDAEQEQFSQELRIASEGEKLSYVAGLYYFQQELDSVTSTIAGKDTSGIFGAPVNAFIEGDGAIDYAEQDHTSYAIFGQADYDLTDSLVLTAGLRWTYEDKEMSNVYTDDAPEEFSPLEDNWGFYLFPPLTPRENADEDFDDNQVTGTIKLSWFMSDTQMFYASYGTGYKSGGINTDRISEDFELSFDAEDSESFEVGMKAEFPEQAVRLNVALHMTDTNDLQTTSFQGNGFYLSNAGTAETWGLEADVNWAPTDNTTLALAYAYLDGEYSDFENGPCWTSTPWHTGQPDPGANGDGSCDRSGGELAGAPEHAVVVSANQDFQLSSNTEGFVYAEYSYVDDRMTDVNNDPAKADDSYGLLNVRTGLYYSPYDLTVTLWGRNLTDEEYTSIIADPPGQEGRLISYHTEPRTWGITLRKDF